MARSRKRRSPSRRRCRCGLGDPTPYGITTGQSAPLAIPQQRHGVVRRIVVPVAVLGALGALGWWGYKKFVR